MLTLGGKTGVAGTRALGLALCLAAFGMAGAGARASDAFFPARVNAGGDELVLNGKGVRHMLFVALYECALYLPQRMADPGRILQHPGPIVLRARIIAGDPGNSIPEDWRGVLRDELSDRMYRKFRGFYRDLEQGDEVEVRYRPGAGTDVWLNGKRLFTAPDRNLIDALLRLWIGDEPVSTELKYSLTGG